MRLRGTVQRATIVYTTCTPGARLVLAESAPREESHPIIAVSGWKEKLDASTHFSFHTEAVMKTAWFALPAVALLVVACKEPTTPLAARSDQSSLGSILASAQGSSAVIHQVSVGGSDQDVTLNTDANFSLVAVQKADGSVQGQWSDQFGQGQGGVQVDVNCLVVAGNQAWIGGIIRSGSTGQGGVDLSGLPALTRVADLGTSANDAPDAISFTFIGLAVQCGAQPNLPLFAMTGGQVSVK